MLIWRLIHIASAALGMVGTAILVAFSLYGAASVPALSLISVASLLASGIYGTETLRLACAALAIGVGVGGTLTLSRRRYAIPKTARRLRFVCALCCALAGMAAIGARFPIASRSDRAAWSCVGLLLPWVFGVFANSRFSGRHAVEPTPRPSASDLPGTPLLIDALSLIIAVAWLVLCLLDPSIESALVVLLIVLFAGFTSMAVQQLRDPASFLRGQPIAGMAWVGIVMSLIGWALSSAAYGPPEAHAWGWILLGAGPGQIAWLLAARPTLAGYPSSFRSLADLLVGRIHGPDTSSPHD